MAAVDVPGSLVLVLAATSVGALGTLMAGWASANKYALNVRFMLPETVARPRLAERDVAFELTFCSL